MTIQDFSPEHIHEFVPESEQVSIFNVGSNYFFANHIENFEPKDYDYVALVKEQEYFLDRFHYMYLDIFYFYYKEDDTKEELLQHMLQLCEQRCMFSVQFLCANVCEKLGITLDDIAQHQNEIRTYLEKGIELSEKYTYLLDLFNFQIQNHSFELSEEQLQSLYNTYKNSKDTRKFISVKIIPKEQTQS